MGACEISIYYLWEGPRPSRGDSRYHWSRCEVIHTYILPLITTYSHDNVHYDILYCFCSTRYSFLKDDCVKEVESLEEVYKRGDIAESKYLILKGFKSHLGDSELVWNIPSPADTLVLSKAYYAYHKGNEASSSSL